MCHTVTMQKCKKKVQPAWYTARYWALSGKKFKRRPVSPARDRFDGERHALTLAYIAPRLWPAAVSCLLPALSHVLLKLLSGHILLGRQIFQQSHMEPTLLNTLHKSSIWESYTSKALNMFNYTRRCRLEQPTLHTIYTII